MYLIYIAIETDHEIVQLFFFISKFINTDYRHCSWLLSRLSFVVLRHVKEDKSTFLTSSRLNDAKNNTNVRLNVSQRL